MPLLFFVHAYDKASHKVEMAPRDILMLIAVLVLIGLTAFFLYRGCSCLRMPREGFANKKAAGKKSDLTEEELELFEDLKADKYSAKQIDKMVANGIIDQGLVEKFLNKMDTFEAMEADEEEEEEKQPKKRVAAKRAAPSKKA